MFNAGDIIELEGSDSKYVVLKTVNDLGKIFILLTDQEEPTLIKFCVLEGDRIKVIQDPKLIDKITKMIE